MIKIKAYSQEHPSGLSTKTNRGSETALDSINAGVVLAKTRIEKGDIRLEHVDGLRTRYTLYLDWGFLYVRSLIAGE